MFGWRKEPIKILRCSRLLCFSTTVTVSPFQKYFKNISMLGHPFEMAGNQRIFYGSCIISAGKTNNSDDQPVDGARFFDTSHFRVRIATLEHHCASCCDINHFVRTNVLRATVAIPSRSGTVLVECGCCSMPCLFEVLALLTVLFVFPVCDCCI